MGKRIVKAILLVSIITLLSGYSAMAQSGGNVRSSVYESKICEYSEVDDYKHSHFNRALHGRRSNERINLQTRDVLLNENYKMQAGAPSMQTIDASAIRERSVSEDDVIVNERDYKHRGSF